MWPPPPRRQYVIDRFGSHRASVQAVTEGRGGPLLALLHGLGGTAGVWTPMLTLARLREWDTSASDIEGGGHNAMVDAPDAAWSWVGSRT